MDDSVAEILLVKEEGEYGEEFKSHCLEIYKMYVERADAISARREAANTFFLSINTGLIAIVGYIDDSEILAKLAIGIAGAILSYFWYSLLQSYKGLNAAKFRVIHQIEKKLPLSPYDAEWEFLGRGEDYKKYKPFTHTEVGVPIIFIALHLLVTTISVIKLCS